jgi:hypothetical protein
MCRPACESGRAVSGHREAHKVIMCLFIYKMRGFPQFIDKIEA